MPPFGPAWFGPLSDPENPLGALRHLWIFLNQQEDEREQWEKQKHQLDYIGFYVNPDLYRQMRKKDTAVTSAGSMQIIKENPEYDDRLNAAFRGEVRIKEQREDIAERVATLRDEADLRKNPPDPRIHTPVDTTDYQDDVSTFDTLTVERKPPKRK